MANEPVVGTGKPRPFVCPQCRGTEDYFGRLVWESEPEPATCPNHKKPVLLEEING